jgi:tRNA (adenine22-N1)-methyltransferase
VNISDRLRNVAEAVELHGTLADVGCDHALTDIYLIEHDIVKKCLAMDLRPGPLLKAKSNIEDSHLSASIELRLSDGLEKTDTFETDTVIISGMGGRLIISIFEKYRLRSEKNFRELVISPHSDVSEVRRYLTSEGYVITDDNMVRDAGKYYQIIHLFSSEEAGKRLTDNELSCACLPYRQEEYLYGRYMLKKLRKYKRYYNENERSFLNAEIMSAKDIDSAVSFSMYLKNEQKKLNSIIAGLSGQDGEEALHRKAELRGILGIIESICFDIDDK